MSNDKILIIILGMLLIVFIYWFFLGKKSKSVAMVNNEIDVIIDGGYSPDHIKVVRSVTTKINFFRKDPSSCLEEIVLADFNFRQFLPLNKKVSISIKPTSIGTYSFTCGMNMFHGKIEVVEA